MQFNRFEKDGVTLGWFATDPEIDARYVIVPGWDLQDPSSYAVVQVTPEGHHLVNQGFKTARAAQRWISSQSPQKAAKGGGKVT